VEGGGEKGEFERIDRRKEAGIRKRAGGNEARRHPAEQGREGREEREGPLLGQSRLHVIGKRRGNRQLDLVA